MKMNTRVVLIASICFIGCQTSRSLKTPKPIKTYAYSEFYLPLDDFLKVENNQNRDTSIVSFYSQLLTSFKEPNLSKYVGESSVFRLTLDRTFANYISIRIVNSEKGIKITYKKTAGIGGYYLDDLKETNDMNLAETDWNNLMDLTNQFNFWGLQTDIASLPQTDGESWLLEANIKGKYHFIYRSNPGKNDEIQKIGKMIITLSEMTLN